MRKRDDFFLYSGSFGCPLVYSLGHPSGREHPYELQKSTSLASGTSIAKNEKIMVKMAN